LAKNDARQMTTIICRMELRTAGQALRNSLVNFYFSLVQHPGIKDQNPEEQL
jgi:hypothetical protein